MRCEICGRETKALISYEGLKTKFRFACKECYKKLKEGL